MMRRAAKAKICAAVAAGVCFLLLMAPTCRFFKEGQKIECSLVELKPSPTSGYFDAVVRIESIRLDNSLKEGMSLYTPTQSFALADLSFIEDGESPLFLEKGDVFVIPLRKPDWKFTISAPNDIYSSLNFWDKLPLDKQWHPTKSEAMQVAESLKVKIIDGLPQPVAEVLPEEWTVSDEQLPDMDNPCGIIVYQKSRADEMKEEVAVNYCLLSEKESRGLAASSEEEFLASWTEWAHKFGKSTVIAGHNAVFWDMPGIGSYGWSYRYIYVDNDVVVQVDLEADPREWGKSAQEKMREGKTRKIFLRYGYGPVGEPAWQILIEIRLTGEGLFHKRSKGGITIDKAFQLDDDEMAAIRSILEENRFGNMHSRSGLPGGVDTFLSVLSGNQYQTIEMKNVDFRPYKNIENIIRGIVLPKVDEH